MSHRSDRLLRGQSRHVCADCGEIWPHACAGPVQLPGRLRPVTRQQAVFNAAVLHYATGKSRTAQEAS